MILLFTDFGYDGPYAGQVKAVLARDAPTIPVIDLMHDAPAHDPRAAAYLLAALTSEMPEGAICLGVVDPGVGGDRIPIVQEADGRWFVGPDNGLFEIVQRRAARARRWAITWRPDRLSRSFHGRDLFAPVAAALARGESPPGDAHPERWYSDPSRPDASWPDDLASIVYIDRFGNAMTGLRAGNLDESSTLNVGNTHISYAPVFSEVPLNGVFWYTNSCGLIEIAINQGNAADVHSLEIGDAVIVETA
jgi:S-adenosylmethionine hydrolase